MPCDQRKHCLRTPEKTRVRYVSFFRGEADSTRENHPGSDPSDPSTPWTTAPPQFASILSLVSAEQGISLVPESMQQLNLKGIVFRKIRGSSHTINLAIAQQRTRPPQLAVNFVSLARALSGHV